MTFHSFVINSIIIYSQNYRRRQRDCYAIWERHFNGENCERSTSSPNVRLTYLLKIVVIFWFFNFVSYCYFSYYFRTLLPLFRLRSSIFGFKFFLLSKLCNWKSFKSWKKIQWIICKRPPLSRRREYSVTPSALLESFLFRLLRCFEVHLPLHSRFHRFILLIYWSLFSCKLTVAFPFEIFVRLFFEFLFLTDIDKIFFLFNIKM